MGDGILSAAAVAKELRYERITAVEFGVADVNGLLALEEGARQATELSGVAIDVVGFDAGAGLPNPPTTGTSPSRGARAIAQWTPRLRRRLLGRFWGLSLCLDP